MESEQYVEAAGREDSYFWYVGRREILADVLLRSVKESPSADRKILDYGCGSGGNIAVLGRFGVVSGVDISEIALGFAQKKGFAELVRIEGLKTPFLEGSFDLVSSLDVFEHIEDDVATMKECHRLLKPGGILLVTVPAHQWLWSLHDVALHHFRRYSYKQLQEKLRLSGFEILEGSHFVTLAVPVNLLRKLREKLRRRPPRIATWDVEFSPFINKVLLVALRVEKILMRYLPIPFGSSMIMVARKL